LSTDRSGTREAKNPGGRLRKADRGVAIRTRRIEGHRQSKHLSK